MIVSCYPRSGSSWFVRIVSESLNLYLTNKDRTYLSEGFGSRHEKAKALSSGGQIAFIDKSHYESFRRTKNLKQNLDNKFLFLYRDPRDAILSYFYFVFFRKKMASRRLIVQYLKEFEFFNAYTLISGDFGNITLEKYFETFAKYEIKRWKKYYREWHDRPEVLSLRYEDVVKDPVIAIHQVANYIDSPFDEDLAKRVIEKWDITNTRKAFGDSSLPENARMVRTGKSGNWKEELTQDHLALFDKAFRDWADILYPEKAS